MVGPEVRPIADLEVTGQARLRRAASTNSRSADHKSSVHSGATASTLHVALSAASARAPRIIVLHARTTRRPGSNTQDRGKHLKRGWERARCEAEDPQRRNSFCGQRRALSMRPLEPDDRREVPVNMGEVAVTAGTTLVAVLLGGWLTTLAQDRGWRRDHQRQWRDIRLTAYTSYLTAFREYIAYVLQPTAQITAVPRPQPPNDLMPFFDEKGSAYKERLEAAKTSLRLIAGRSGVVRAANAMIRCARLLAADRAMHEPGSIPSERFEQLWSAEREFVLAAREELGLASDFEIGDRPLDPEPSGAPDSPLAAWTRTSS